jgi:hypothetical protein
VEVRIATAEEIPLLSKLSVALGNVPFFPDQATVALLEHGEGEDGGAKEIVGFAAVQNAQHAAGSWVKEEFRRQKYSYDLRHALDNELRRRGFSIYFALPRNDFQKQLFRKYGTVTEHMAQIRHL